jgi:AbrB family looped-hinge helix DNA binding protein
MMARVLDGKVSPEGRVVIPAEIRTTLGISPGDHVQFIVDDGDVRLVTARTLAEQVWANNTGGDAADAVDLVHATRDEQANREDRWSSEPFDAPASSGDDVLETLFPAA